MSTTKELDIQLAENAEKADKLIKEFYGQLLDIVKDKKLIYKVSAGDPSSIEYDIIENKGFFSKPRIVTIVFFEMRKKGLPQLRAKGVYILVRIREKSYNWAINELMKDFKKNAEKKFMSQIKLDVE
ncbi:MAG: hypothetical protein ACP5NW_03720 [Candidatus Woesearchaeota archaeon]